MTQAKQSIAIIGAGAAGMSAAWDFARAGHNVMIYEAEERVGGLAGGFRDDGWAWSMEKFYHHWFESDSDILTLAQELGLRDQIMFPHPKTSYWLDGKIYRSEMNTSMLQLPLSFVSLVRMGLAGVYLKFITRDWHALESVTADSWLRRWMGDEAYSRLWKPLLIGKFADRYTEINMAWLWARIKTRTQRLGIFTGGFQAFLDAFAAKLTELGVQIKLSTPVQAISVESGKPVLTINGEAHTFDKVLTTTSPSLLLRMAPALKETPYGQQAAALKSIGALCVVLALKRPLLTDGTYWLNLPATNPDKAKNPFPFLALVEHTNWMDRAHYGDDHLVYCGDYVPTDHEYFQMTEAQLIERFSAVLPTVNPTFKPDWIRKAWVFRAPYAQPVPGVNHSRNIPPLQTPLPGVWWASMSQVYPWDRGTNFAVEIGRRAAREMLANI
ncbi:MAG: NAD(P)/FAD-dependent oxidoreductase [Chloroflexota bacterium]|nr:NAD(P)/FAD-dependent oxidoreductase [Chloroflexota bacterium]